VSQDLLQNHKELFHARDKELERERKLLADQRKLQDVVSLNKVSNSTDAAD